MKRLFFSVITASLLVISVACSSSTPNVMSPTGGSSSPSSSTGENPPGFYTITGVVQSDKEVSLAGAKIEAFGSGNDGRVATSDASGTFLLLLRPGRVSLIVQKVGWYSWATELTVTANDSSIRATLTPNTLTLQ
jgi:hypothetical protein